MWTASPCLKQQILAFLQLRGFAYGTGTHWTKTFRTWVCGLPMSEVDQITLNSSWFQLTQLEQQVLQLETKLAEMADTDLYRDTGSDPHGVPWH